MWLNTGKASSSGLDDAYRKLGRPQTAYCGIRFGCMIVIVLKGSNARPSVRHFERHFPVADAVRFFRIAETLAGIPKVLPLGSHVAIPDCRLLPDGSNKRWTSKLHRPANWGGLLMVFRMDGA
jgi:hypothetical protein